MSKIGRQSQAFKIYNLFLIRIVHEAHIKKTIKQNKKTQNRLSTN